ncbi:hypothetical protein FOA52_001562 [Chlamydomonas sp. UWO 241]|nr:hypothetical protein FOA52_001562 [Chlamydomonas sp. UWO 241]
MHVLHHFPSRQRQQRQHIVGPGDRYQGAVFITHHKTGTSLVGCIAGALARRIEAACNHTITPVYVNNDLTAGVTGYYLAQTKAIAEQRHGAAATAPYMLLKTGEAPLEYCYDSEEMERSRHTIVDFPASHPIWPGAACATPREWPPGVGTCPCNGNKTDCFSLGTCFGASADSKLLYVHVVRDPLDVVVSAYSYHRKDPPPEPWLMYLLVEHLLNMLKATAMDPGLLDAVFDNRSQPAMKSTYWAALRTLPEEKGLQLEMLRSSISLWPTARLAQRGGSTLVRYEDLMHDMAGTLSRILKPLNTPCMAAAAAKTGPGSLLAETEAECSPAKWSAGKQADPTQIQAQAHRGSYTPEDKARWVGLLISWPYARRVIPELQLLLGYPAYEGTGRVVPDAVAVGP